MSFADAVRSCLTQYVGFSGRARRSEYWWFVLFGFLVGIATGAVDGVLGTGSIVSTLAGLALLLPSLGAGVRRLHDTGRSGWWILIGLVPLIGAIVLIVFFVGDSVPGANEHGPNPKQVDAGFGGGWGAQPGVPPQQGYGDQGYGQQSGQY